MRRYLEIYGIMLRNSLIREMSFKANFILWMMVEVLWFLRPDSFLQHHLRAGRSDRRLDEMGSGPARRHAPDHRAAFPGVLLRQRREHSGTGPHRKTRLAPRPAARQPVRRLDETVRARQRGQRAPRRRRGRAFARASCTSTPAPVAIVLYLVALGFGVAIHYSIMLTLAAVSFWIVRAQGLVYGYFNFLNIARYPDVIFPQVFRFVFGWIIPVIIVANIPGASADQVVRPAGLADVSPHRRPGTIARRSQPAILALGAPALFEREFLSRAPECSPRIALGIRAKPPCAKIELPLIKPPLAPADRHGRDHSIYGQFPRKQGFKKARQKSAGEEGCAPKKAAAAKQRPPAAESKAASRKRRSRAKKARCRREAVEVRGKSGSEPFEEQTAARRRHGHSD